MFAPRGKQTVGFNSITPNEERAFVRQLEMAQTLGLPVIIHLPHTHKLKGTERTVDILKSLAMNHERILLDHNTEETLKLSLESGWYAGMTVYPISKSSICTVHSKTRLLQGAGAAPAACIGCFFPDLDTPARFRHPFSQELAGSRQS